MPTQKLRFKDDNGQDFPEWELDPINKLADINPRSAKIPEKFYYLDLECVNQGKITKDLVLIDRANAPSRAKRVVFPDDVLFQNVRPYQQNNLYLSINKDFPIVASTGYSVIRVKGKNSSKFIFYAVHESKFLDSVLMNCSGGTYPAINSSQLSELFVNVPCLEEQHKIAEFLSTVDEKVEVLEKKLEALNSLKKGFMQRIFSQELRFKDDSGQDFPEWKTKCLGEISERITRKNSNSETDIPLTISAEYGLVNQIEYFNKQIASKDLSKYFLLEKGEFAYNKSYSKGYDFGVIKRLEKYQNGALSSLYICFNVINQDCDFMMYYFDSLKWYKNMPEICQEGARNHGLLNCSVKEFFTIELELPSSKEEQRKIAEFLSAFDEKIEAVKRQVEAMKQVKKGLLQQMFVQ